MRSIADIALRYGPAVLVHVLLVFVWHVWVTWWEIPSYVVPTPLETILALGEEYDWWHNTMITAGEIVFGYLAAVLFGVSMALLCSWSNLLNATVMPLAISTNMIPKVALGPLVIVWFSYGFWPNAGIAFAICFLPVLLTTARGLAEVEPDLLDLARALRATRWQIFLKIQLPNALPYIFSGMKVAVVLAVAGAIVGEFIASEEGLGYLMLQVQVTLDTAAMFMAVLLITLIGVVLYAAVLLLERLVIVRDSRIPS